MLKNTDRLLLRNLDKDTISNFDYNYHPGLKTERSLAAEKQDRIQLSVDLKQSFNDFKIEENYKADKSNYLRLP